MLAIGELNPDLILSGFAVNEPVIGTEQLFTSQILTLGSSTAIACVLMQRLGLRTAMAALVGDDEHGRYCQQILTENSVDTQGVRRHAQLATGITISLSYPDDRMLLTRCGTMTTFGAADIAADLLTAARHLHVGSFFIQSGLRPDLPALFSAARARGQTTSLDLGWDPSETWDTAALAAVLPQTTVVFPNRVELAAVTGIDDLNLGLARLHQMGAGIIALKLGSAGAIWSTPLTNLRHSGFAVRVVDTTGAGDAFNAGVLRRWLGGHVPADCLAFGNACGALTAQAAGGIGGLHNEAQALDFIRSAKA